MWRIIDIADEGRHLSLFRGSLVVTEDGTELGSVPIRDVQAVIIHGHKSTLSLSLAAALAEAGVPLVLSDRAHMPVALSLPVSGHFEMAGRVAMQAALSPARKSRVWRDIIKGKIQLQAEALHRIGHKDAESIRKLVGQVKPADPQNLEARAARYYWTRLFDEKFRRDTNGQGLNAALNYGYAVLRATVARAVVAAGLTPALGVFHSSRLNAFQLVDDLMEPLRPVVDFCVWENRINWSGGLPREGKAVLADLVNMPQEGADGQATLSRIASQIVMSFVDVAEGSRKSIWLPHSLVPPKQRSLDWHEGS